MVSIEVDSRSEIRCRAALTHQMKFHRSNLLYFRHASQAQQRETIEFANYELLSIQLIEK